MANLTFGPPGDQWLYNGSSRTYDLRRGQGNGFTIKTTQGAADTAVTADPSATALLVVDMQNYFLDPRCRQHPLGVAAVQPTLDVINKCREIGIQVIWVNWGLTDQDIQSMPASIMRSFSRSTIESASANTTTTADPLKVGGLGADLGEGRGRALVAGEWNSQIYPPLASAVAQGDIQSPKNRMSALWNSEQPLWKSLEKSGKKTLLFAGVNTDQCVLGTLVDAYNAGWDCIMIEDCCATKTENARGVCLTNVSNLYGFVVSSQSIVNGVIAS